MDRKNLYYIVTKGTNDRLQTVDKRPFISESDAADREIDKWSKDREKILIADFEDKFEDKDVE